MCSGSIARPRRRGHAALRLRLQGRGLVAVWLLGFSGLRILMVVRIVEGLLLAQVGVKRKPARHGVRRREQGKGERAPVFEWDGVPVSMATSRLCTGGSMSPRSAAAWRKQDPSRPGSESNEALEPG